MKKIVLKISGMSCAACAARIDKVIEKTNGVVSANVNLALEVSTIEYDEKTITEKEIIEKINGLGYIAEKTKMIIKRN